MRRDTKIPRPGWEKAKTGKPARSLFIRLLTAAAALVTAALYFRRPALVLGGAALVYQMILPLVLQQRESRRGGKLRKDALLWLDELTMALKAGKSLTTATGDLALYLTGGPDGNSGGPGAGKLGKAAVSCWRHCLGLIYLRYPIGLIYREMAQKLALPEWESLAGLIGTATLTGANLPQVFIRSAAGLREQMESRALLEAALASRRMEGCLLAAAPAVYTAFLCLVTPAYMRPLFTGGGWVMAAVVFLLQLAGCRIFFRLLLREESGQPILELAGFQEEVALQLQAGLSLPEAWQKTVYGRKQGKRDGDAGGADIGGCLAFTAKRLAMGMPFIKAMERLQREEKAGAELRRLAEMVEQNYDSGGGSLGELLRLEAREIRQRALLGRRAKDAKRETELLFPMILLLLSALVLTAAPALLSV